MSLDSASLSAVRRSCIRKEDAMAKFARDPMGGISLRGGGFV